MLQIHYIRASFFARYALFMVVGLALVALVACSSNNDDPDTQVGASSGGGNSGISSGGDVPGTSSGGNPPGGSSSDGGNPGVSSSSRGDTPGTSSGSGSGDVDVENAIKIEYKGGSVEITNPYSEVKIEEDGANVVVTIPDASTVEYNFILSGTTSNGSIKFYGNVKKGLYLNGVNITNNKGPAINIQKSKRISVHLVDGTQNYLTDASGYKCKNFAENEEQVKGTFFSEGRLEFNKGNGSLEVKGKCNHAIIADNAIEIKYGKITVSESTNDGIHANDSIKVSGGNITVKSTGDAIQSEKVPSGPVDEWVVFSGGTINVQTTGIKSHGIASEGPVTIKGTADITIKVAGNGSKGIRSHSWLEFDGGKTSIEATGTTDKTDPTDESNSAGIKLSGFIDIIDGELTIKTTGDGAKGINVEGNANIKGGKINIDADDDGLRVHKTLKITGGTGSIKSKKKSAIKADDWDKNKGNITTQDGGS